MCPEMSWNLYFPWKKLLIPILWLDITKIIACGADSFCLNISNQDLWLSDKSKFFLGIGMAIWSDRLYHAWYQIPFTLFFPRFTLPRGFVLKCPENFSFFLIVSWNVLKFAFQSPGKNGKMSWKVLKCPEIWILKSCGHHEEQEKGGEEGDWHTNNSSRHGVGVVLFSWSFSGSIWCCSF